MKIDPATLAASRDSFCVIDMQEPRAQWIARSEPITGRELGARLYELIGRGALCFVCEDGINSSAAARALAGHGVETCFLDGGMKAWRSAGLPVEGETPRVAEPRVETRVAEPAPVAPSITELVSRAGAIARAWVHDETSIEGDLPSPDEVLRAWFDSGRFSAADRRADVASFVLAPGPVSAVVVHVDVWDHDDSWSIELVWAQDASRAVLVGAPEGALDALLGAGARPFVPFARGFVLGRG